MKLTEMKKILFLLFFLSSYMVSWGQIIFGENQEIRNPSAIIQFNSSLKGVLLSQIGASDTNLIQNPIGGMMVIDSTNHRIYYYRNNIGWRNLNDRQPVKIYPRISDQNENYYIGPTDVNFSNDQRANIFMGLIEANNSRQGSYNIGFGDFNYSHQFLGNRNSAIGSYIYQNGVNGEDNLALGIFISYTILNSPNNRLSGNRNLLLAISGPQNLSTGSDNLVLGNRAMQNITTGNNNIGIGGGLEGVINGNNNIGIGQSALTVNTSNSLGVGNNSLLNLGRLNTTENNTSFANYDNSYLYNSTSNHSNNNNLFLGWTVARNFKYGSYNIFIGDSAAVNFDHGDGNIAIGKEALTGPSFIGNKNILIGRKAGSNLLLGDNNIAIGDSAQFPTSTCHQCLVIGRIIYGKNIYTNTAQIGINTNNPVFTLDINGHLYTGPGGILASSDKRLKRDILPLGSQFENLMQLRPVKFKWNEKSGGNTQETQLGFIAQEMEEIYPNIVRSPENSYKSIAYSELIPVMVKSLQELDQMVQDLKKDLNKK